MVLKVLTFVFSFVSIGFLHAQCAYEQTLNLYRNANGKVKILETNDHCSLIACDVGTDTLTGDVTNMDIFLTKKDSCGNEIWTKTYAFNAGSLDFFRDIVELSDGGFMMVTHSENDGIGGAYNFIVWKLSSEGSVIWKKFNGKGIDASTGNCILYNPNRNSFLIAGTIERAYPSGGGLSNRPYILELDSNGGVIQEKDLIINQDTLSSSAKSLEIVELYLLKDSSFLGLIISGKADSTYLVRIDKNLNFSKLTRPLLKKFRAWTGAMGGIMTIRKNYTLSFLRENCGITACWDQGFGWGKLTNQIPLLNVLSNLKAL
ncbi:MAG: hypothetical protein V4590_10305 [Bacteroidota bacterium]